MIPEMDDRHLPFRLGSVLRVPSYAYPAWGLAEGNYHRESEQAYDVEFVEGSPRWMQYVSDASVRAGLGDFPQRLRAENARVVASLIQETAGLVTILDVGAGAGHSAREIHRALDGNARDRARYTLLDGARHRLDAAEALLQEEGITDYAIELANDTQIAERFEEGAFAVATSVAGVHAHAYLEPTFSQVAYVVRPGGFFVTADWHNSMWEHPRRVYQFLMGLEWDTKKQDMDAFRRAFPRYAREPGQTLGHDENANEMIRRFWTGWAEVRREAVAAHGFRKADEMYLLEGHRPVERYLQEMEQAGFQLDTIATRRLVRDQVMNGNPHQVLPDSRLLMVTVGQKP
ncbi:MAG: methyltransferase domain-containing protein [Candidatus Aenigmarchaeota archaeon]|nr:methyltransferase domain-containing protein [Candidatus Aenigmarchaeota archaeon]